MKYNNTDLHFDRSACPYSDESFKVMKIWLVVLVIFIIAVFGLGVL